MKFTFQFDNKTSYIKVNKRGSIYILLTIAIGFAATNTMNNLLYIVLSLLLAIMGVSGFFARKNLSGINFSIVPPPEIYRNTPAPFKIRVGSRTKKFNVFIEFEGIKRGIPILEGETEVTVPLVFKFRGPGRINNIKITSSFPFGFFTREEIHHISVEFTVFPHIYRVPLPEYLRGDTATTGIHENRRPGTGGDFLGLRDYQEGDPIKLIHWKASTRRLVTKMFSGPSSNEIILTEEDLTKMGLEDQIDELASLSVALLRAGFSVGINFHGLKIHAGGGEHQRIKILVELSWL